MTTKKGHQLKKIKFHFHFENWHFWGLTCIPGVHRPGIEMWGQRIPKMPNQRPIRVCKISLFIIRSFKGFLIKKTYAVVRCSRHKKGMKKKLIKCALVSIEIFKNILMSKLPFTPAMIWLQGSQYNKQSLNNSFSNNFLISWFFLFVFMQ